MNKNDRLQLTIEDMSVDGEGIGHADGMTLFVKGAVVGDEIIAGVTKVKKSMCYARVVEIITASPHRVAPICPVSGPCGGCQLQVLNYDKQLELKTKFVKDNLQRIGGFSPEEIQAITEPIIGMDEPYHYRNKLQLPVGLDKNGDVVMGFYLSHSHDIVPINTCHLSHPQIDAVIPIIRRWIQDKHISIYHNGKGMLRHILIRYAAATRELMVCLIGNVHLSDKTDRDRKLLDKLYDLADELQDIPGMTSIVFNENCKNTNVILGDKTHLIWGRDYICDLIGEVSFNISAKSFYQVNPIQTKRLYDKVAEYAALTGEETVWDLYCGIGTIGLCLSKQAREVFGVEVVPQAIEDARVNAMINGIINAHFTVGKVEDIVSEIAGKESGQASRDIDNGVPPHPDIIIVDPPRKGCDSACLDAILKLQPKKVIYVSCNPSTLSRDLKRLCENTYTLSKLTPVDMFPQTHHVETCCLLTDRQAQS